MGTRRSRHNKGRKPFYKNIDREAAKDFVCEVPKPKRGKCNYCTRTRECLDSVCDQCAFVKSDMDADVWASFMAANPEWWKRPEFGGYKKKEKPKPSPFDWSKAPLPTKRPQETILNAPLGKVFELPAVELVEASKRDVIVQLYKEKKITIGQLRAGRKWQFDMEESVLQPSQSIDWSNPTRMYQDSDLTERQYAAMKRRRDMQDYSCSEFCKMLDFVLNADRGRRVLMPLLNMTGEQVNEFVIGLLKELSAFYAIEGRDRRHAVTEEPEFYGGNAIWAR